jgi:hypothetical protein
MPSSHEQRIGAFIFVPVSLGSSGISCMVLWWGCGDELVVAVFGDLRVRRTPNTSRGFRFRVRRVLLRWESRCSSTRFFLG